MLGDWGQEEKGTTEDEMVGWYHQLNGHGFGWTPGVGDGQGGLACCGSWDCKERTWMSEWTELNWTVAGTEGPRFPEEMEGGEKSHLSYQVLLALFQFPLGVGDGDKATFVLSSISLVSDAINIQLLLRRKVRYTDHRPPSHHPSPTSDFCLPVQGFMSHVINHHRCFIMKNFLIILLLSINCYKWYMVLKHYSFIGRRFHWCYNRVITKCYGNTEKDQPGDL